MDKVSIVIPTYNFGSFISDTITSVTNSDYNNIEIVVVDDGSTDSTGDIVKGLSGNIKYIFQNNSGRSAARNNGMQHAGGKYIVFLDSDDLLTTNSISERVRYLEANPNMGWVCTDAMEFDQTGDLRLFFDQFNWLDLTRDHFCQLLRGCFPLTSTVMVRSELINRTGGFNSRIKYGEDIEFFLRLLLVYKLGVIDKPLTRRRIHPTQSVSNTFDRWDWRVKIYSNFKPLIGGMNSQQREALNDALKYAYYKLGECYWERNDFKTAQKMFINSFCGSSRTFKTLLYAALCSMPENVIFMLRNMKQQQEV